MNGSGSPYEVLLACPSGLGMDQLEVELSSECDRQPHPDPQLEASIASTWETRLAAQPSLFNASKFRYAGFCVLQSATMPDGTLQVERVRLLLGLTDYRTFVGTNLSPHWTRFLPEGAQGAERSRHLASPLGNLAVVQTADGAVVLLQRGTAVGEAPCCPVFPGGHSEPAEVGVVAHAAGGKAPAELNRRIAAEMFAGIVREVVEETGVPASSLSDVRFLGVSQRAANLRPVAAFSARCSLSGAEVQQRYRGAAHAFESTQLRSVPPEALAEAAHDMPGCHMGGAALFQMGLRP